MSIPVITGGAAATAAALLDAAALIEEAGVPGLTVTCCNDQVSILVATIRGDAARRAGIVAALGELAGAAGCRQSDTAGERPAAWLDVAGRAGGTVVEITTKLAVRAAPGGTLAAGPGGQQAVIAPGLRPPPGWRWVTELDDPGQEP